MLSVGKLQRYWQDWQPKLQPLVEAKGARLHFPTTLRHVSGTDKTAILQPDGPVCIYNAPQKASSRGSKGKQIVLIDGSFEIMLEDASPHLVFPKCSITILKSEEIPGDSLKLELVEAIHFDCESPPGDKKSKHFHPIFHAQRGISLTPDRVVPVLAEMSRLKPEQVQILDTNKAVLGTPYLRLPTPQMDVFSVLTMVAADYFCNPGDAVRDKEMDEAAGGKPMGASRHNRSNVVERFVALLDLLRDPANLARQGSTALSLRGRLVAEEFMCVGHWYPECACP